MPIEPAQASDGAATTAGPDELSPAAACPYRGPGAAENPASQHSPRANAVHWPQRPPRELLRPFPGILSTTISAENDPWSRWRDDRESDGILWVEDYTGEATAVILRHGHARELLQDPRLRHRKEGRDALKEAPCAWSLPEFADNDHQRAIGKTAVAGIRFGSRNRRSLSDRLHGHAVAILKVLHRNDAPIDLVADYARPLAVRAVGELLGIAADQQPQFLIGVDQAIAASADKQAELAAIERIQDFLRPVANDLAQEPDGGLLSLLVNTRDGDGQILQIGETLDVATMIIRAGYGSTTDFLSNSLAQLLRKPRSWSRLLASPGLVPSAVEECARIDMAHQRSLGRVTTQHIRIATTGIPKDTPVLIMLAAANRDPRAFKDPLTFDIGRTPNPHLGWGYGDRFCLGAEFVRLLAQVAISTLAHEVPALALRGPISRREQDNGLPAVSKLPVTTDK